MGGGLKKAQEKQEQCYDFIVLIKKVMSGKFHIVLLRARCYPKPFIYIYSFISQQPHETDEEIESEINYPASCGL